MRIINVKLFVEDVMNPSDQEARDLAIEMICEAFGKEERLEHPRLKLILIEAEHRDV